MAKKVVPEVPKAQGKKRVPGKMLVSSPDTKVFIKGVGELTLGEYEERMLAEKKVKPGVTRKTEMAKALLRKIFEKGSKVIPKEYTEIRSSVMDELELKAGMTTSWFLSNGYLARSKTKGLPIHYVLTSAGKDFAGITEEMPTVEGAKETAKELEFVKET